MSFVDFLLALQRAPRARRVVTLPPDAHPVEFAWAARHQGADLLEVRTDLTPLELDLGLLARALPLLVAERAGLSAPADWRRHAALLDAAEGSVRSHHAERPLSTTEALRLWDGVPAGVQVKHVEPLGPLGDAPRLFETQRQLEARLGPGRVTVLTTGPLALPFRALLAERNALDYLALSPAWSAAVGQRLLADAVRATRRPTHHPLTARLAILGHPLAHSRSPRLHAQPFDRLDVPPDTDLAALLAALRPHYRGFAVTNPFKKAVARAVDASAAAVNTLVRAPQGWQSLNSDVAGAKAALEHLAGLAGARAVTVLGDGGVSQALTVAADELGLALVFKRRDTLDGVERGAVVWTWPAHVEPPPALRFEAAHVGVIAYGAPARTIASKVRALGGIVVRLGPRWFIAQARQQRTAWESAT
ncbi:MAG: shikimate dehydrogenase [Myxococcaceae bacterium]|nr:shikimate dehydrogenase [Myxococcaceae bacterium]